MQKDCKSKKVNVGMLIAKNNVSIDKLIQAASDYFWGQDDSGDNLIFGFSGGFGNSELLPVNVRIEGSVESNVKTNIQNTILNVFSEVIYVNFVDGDADIIIHTDKDSFSKQFGSREYGKYWDSSFYTKELISGRGFDYCGFIDHTNRENIAPAFASCLGIKATGVQGKRELL